MRASCARVKSRIGCCLPGEVSCHEGCTSACAAVSLIIMCPYTIKERVMYQHASPRFESIICISFFLACVLLFSPPVTCESSAGHAPSTDRFQHDPMFRLDEGKCSTIRFTENRGQIVDTDGRLRSDIHFTARIDGVMLFLRSTGMSHVFSRTEQISQPVSEATGQKDGADILSDRRTGSISCHRMDMEFIGANPYASIRGEGRISGWSHFYLSHCPEGITHVPSYARVVYEDIYDGINCIIYSKDGDLKYDFLVQPGVDPSQIRLRFQGQLHSTINEHGEHLISGFLGSIKEHVPVSLQNGVEIRTAYKIDHGDLVFEVSDWDPFSPLLIDPWSTYVGGGGSDSGADIKYDQYGSILIAGYSSGLSFPTKNAYQPVVGGGYDAIVTKFASSGSLQWSTYFGGSSEDKATGIDCGPSGNIAVSGWTWSQDYPVHNAFQAANAGSADLFVASFTSAGILQWSTYYGGSSGESEQSSVAVDDSGNVICAGHTFSSDFPTVNAFQVSHAGGATDNVLGKFSSTGILRWSSYFGGNDNDSYINIGTFGTGSIVGVSQTKSMNRTLLYPLQAVHNGMMDLYIFEMSHAGVLQWATYYGGSGGDGLPSISVSATGWFAISGKTNSVDFPTKNAHQANYGGSYWDAFAVSFQNRTSMSPSVLWSTYFGGTGSEGARDVCRDTYGNVVLTGYAMDNSFPVYKAAQYAYGGGLEDAILVKFSPYGQLQFSSLWGGSSSDEGFGIAVCHSGSTQVGEIAITGHTYSMDFPIDNPFQGSNAGMYDIFLTIFNSSGFIPVDLRSLHAHVHDGDVLLRWETSHECNNAGFRIERKGDCESTDWVDCGFVEAMNTTGAATYEFTDRLSQDLYERVFFYRLRQIDFDGTESLSPTVEVHFEKLPSSVELYAPYPDPADEHVIIPVYTAGSRRLVLRIVNMAGEEVLSLCDGRSLAEGSHVLQASTGHLPSGTYLVELIAGDTRQIRKLMISR